MVNIFAYGSNMNTKRMKYRVPSAEPVCTAKVVDKKLICNKYSVLDGSGKANLNESPVDVVWGVVYKLDPKDLAKLDSFEGGYRREEIEVVTKNGETMKAQAYVSDQLTKNPTATIEYKKHILLGAEEHGLPEDYQEFLRSLPSE